MNQKTPAPTQAVDGEAPEAADSTKETEAVQTTPTPETSQEASQEQAQDADSTESLDDLPTWAQEQIRTLRKEASTHRRQKQEAITAKSEAETALAALQAATGTTQAELQARLDELEPSAALAGRLTELITEQINAEIAEWPDEVKAMAPTGETDPLTMLEWVKTARPLATKLGGLPPIPGNEPRPKQAGGGEQDAKKAGQTWTRTWAAIKP